MNKEPIRAPQISENEGEEDDQRPSSRKDPTQSEGSQDDANSNDGEKQAEEGSESDAQSAKDNESGASDGEEEEERGEIVLYWNFYNKKVFNFLYEKIKFRLNLLW